MVCRAITQWEFKKTGKYYFEQVIDTKTKKPMKCEDWPRVLEPGKKGLAEKGWPLRKSDFTREERAECGLVEDACKHLAVRNIYVSY